MTDPLTLAALGGVALTEAIKLLYDQGTQAMAAARGGGRCNGLR